MGLALNTVQVAQVSRGEVSERLSGLKSCGPLVFEKFKLFSNQFETEKMKTRFEFGREALFGKILS